jgi:nicotinamidase/pyrazinamidase
VFCLKKDYSIGKNDALIVVDVQNDFCPGGALPVPKGDEVVPVLNEYINLFEKAKSNIVATRDWHPSNHISFKSQGGPWPPHCVQNTEGAKFHPDLKLPRRTIVVSKAMNPLKENYSPFETPELKSILKKEGVIRVFVGGLATDYCVKQTILDALELGFHSVLLTDAIAAINADSGDEVRAIDEMTKNGAEQAIITDFLYPLELPLASDPDAERLSEKHLLKLETEKKARMRPRGPYKQIRVERG